MAINGGVRVEQLMKVELFLRICFVRLLTVLGL